MSAFVAIFAREFRLRRVLLVGALAIGLMAPIIPRLQGQSGMEAAQSGAETALLLGLVTCGLFALVLGSGAITRDLADGRLGFDFVRPASGFAIWAGRFGAAVALLFASALLVVVPALLTAPESRSTPVQGESWLPALNTEGAILVGWVGCLVLLLSTHVVTTLFAARSAALGWDLAALVAVGLLLVTAFARLYRSFALDALGLGVILFVLLFLGALIGSSLAQLLIGRTDLVRGHRALTLALWLPLLAGALALEIGSRWVVSPTVREVYHVTSVTEARVGGWFGIYGTLVRRGRLAGQFLIDSATGRVLPQGISVYGWNGSTSFSSDGLIAVWCSDGPKERGVRWVDLSQPEPKIEVAPITLPWSADPPSLSATGKWMAVRSGVRVLVFELRTGTLAKSISVSAAWTGLRMHWLPGDRLRLWTITDREGASESPISITEVQLPAGNPESVGSIELAARNPAWMVSRDASTVLVRENASRSWRLLDGRSGDLLGTIDAPERSTAAFLADGSVAIIEQGQAPRNLVIYDRTAVARQRFDLQDYRALLVAGQPTPGSVLVSGLPAKAIRREGGERRLLLLDRVRGSVRDVGVSWIPPLGAPESTGKLVQTGPATFARWDPATETLKPIVPR